MRHKSYYNPDESTTGVIFENLDKLVQQISTSGNSCNQWQKTFEMKAQEKLLHIFMRIIFRGTVNKQIKQIFNLRLTIAVSSVIFSFSLKNLG